MSELRPRVPSVGRSRVLAWALWDVGSTGLNATVVTFVFAVYLTDSVGASLPGDTSATSWYGWALLAAGIVVAVLAPVTGIWVDAPGLRRPLLAVLTGLAVLLTATMSLIRDDYHYLLPGLVLLAATAACTDLATVPYNAMLRQLSTPQTSGRISGFGLGMGFLGAVVLLLVLYLGFTAGDGDRRGLLRLPVEDGVNVRLAMLLAAAWLLVFALPLLARAPNAVHDLEARSQRVGFFGAYRKLWSEVVGEWRRDHNVVYYLFASAVFRDGLTGIFVFGGVIGVKVYGVTDADVLLFGVSANVIAAVGAIVGGLVDDRLGPKRVIVFSLASMVAVGLMLMGLSGPMAFWVCGLLLCLFIGPILAAARNLMLRLTADGKEGVAFGLYTTVGRAASFLSPWLFSSFIVVFGTDRAGIGGLITVLVAGLIALLWVRLPPRPALV